MANLPELMQPTNQDALAELKDIHLPPPVDQLALAPGWWILLALGLMLLGWLIWLAHLHWKKNRYRRLGASELKACLAAFQEHKNPETFLMEYNRILKRVALSAFPRSQVASLTGEAWVNFLDSRVKEKWGSQGFAMGPGQILIDGLYQQRARNKGVRIKRERLDELTQLGLKWVRHHRVLPEDRDLSKEKVLETARSMTATGSRV